MKLNKLVVSMGLATAVLAGCGGSGSDSDDSFTVTAIDGYIAKGDVTTTCTFGEGSETQTFKGVTDTSGQAIITPSRDGIVYLPEECTSKVTGNAQTYDLDKPSEEWLHELESIPGEPVVSPMTNIAAIMRKVPGNEGLDNEALKGKVLTAFGYDPDDESGDAIFKDYKVAKAPKVGLLAQTAFAITTEAADVLDEKASPANLETLLTAALPKAKEQVEAEIAVLGDEDLSDKVITTAATFPDLDFAADGSVTKDTLDYLVVGTIVAKNSELTDTVKVAQKVKDAQAKAQKAAEQAVEDAPDEEKIARQAVTAKVVVKKVAAQQVVAEKVVVAAEKALENATGAVQAAAQETLVAAKETVAATAAAKAVAESSAAAAKATLLAEEAVKNATEDAKAALQDALEAAKDAAAAAAAEVALEEAAVAALEDALEAAKEALEDALEIGTATGATGGTGGTGGMSGVNQG